MSELVESKFISDRVGKSALVIEDVLEILPIHGRKQIISLNRTQIDIVSKDNVSKAGNHYKVIPTLKGDSIFVRIKLLQTKKSSRFVIESMNSTPFLFNDSLVLSAVLVNEDECDLAHNILKFKKKNNMSKSFEFNDILLQNEKIIKSSMSILLEGETGTGKTTLAKKIHDQSGLTGPFVHINLSAFSSNLLESEIFGHVKGAFTGAYSDKKGALRLANRGTLFLDEIDSIPLELQTKLLLFLDNSKVRPVGCMQEFLINTRIIFASGSSLLKKVESGKMRKDFYFRIDSGYKHHLRPLRADILVIEKFCYNFAITNNLTIDEKLIHFYQTMPWPGNIRQLNAHLERKKIISNTSTLSFDSCDDDLIIQSSELKMIEDNDYEFMSLNQMKRTYAKKVYYKLNCNLANASKVLDISRKSLKNFIEAS